MLPMSRRIRQPQPNLKHIQRCVFWASVCRLGAMLVLLAVLAACGYSNARYQWDQRWFEAERLADHGSYAQARPLYEALLKDAHSPKDARMIRYRLAVLTERQGQYRKAVALYEALWQDGQRDEISGQAVTKAARLMAEELDAEAEGMRLWEELLVRMPEAVGADNARKNLMSRWLAEGDKVAVANIERLYSVLHDSVQGDNLLYDRAKIMRRNGFLEEAKASYRKILETYPSSGFRDDARWLLAEILHGEGRFDEALNELRILAEDREVAWLLGSYDYDWNDNARYWRALIFLHDLKRPLRAVQEFELYLKEYPTSIWRDDVRWNIAQSYLRADDGAAAAGACRDLEEIEPESRWVDDCQALRGRLEAGEAPSALLGKVVTQQ